MIGGLLGVFLSYPLVTRATVFSDGFEAPSLDAFWTVTVQQHYDIALAASPTHGGSQALALTSLASPSEDGGVVLEHLWATPQTGTCSIWFYDHAPSIGDSYAGFYIYNRPSGLSQALSVRDFDTGFYHDNTGSGQTTVPRSLGWHELKVVVDSSGASAFVDGALTSTIATMDSFDAVQVFGGQWRLRPTSTYVFDDFAVSSIPEPGMTAMASLFALCRLACTVKRQQP